MAQGPDFPRDWNRILSAVIAVGWLALCGIVAGVAGVLHSLLPIGAAVASIWFADDLASWSTKTGLVTGQALKGRTPPGLIRALGWIALLACTLARPLLFWLLVPR